MVKKARQTSLFGYLVILSRPINHVSIALRMSRQCNWVPRLYILV